MFSVIVPVYNHKTFVEEAIESAAGCDLVREILMVDDLSTDGSAELIERFPRRFDHKVRILREAEKSNRGAHERLNQLCDAAAGPWISILNSDDVYAPDRFARAQELIAHDCSFITGAVTLIDERSSVIGTKRGNLDPDYPLPAELENADLNRELNLFRALCSENFIMTTSNMIFTKDLFERLHGFRDLRYCHDWDFALRACLLGRPGFSQISLTRYRIHAANTIQEPTPHVDGEVIRLFSRLLDEFPWVTEDWVSLEALKGNRHLGPFISDGDTGRKNIDQRRVGRAHSRTRCLVLIDHEEQGVDDIAGVVENIEALKDVCDTQIVDVGITVENESDVVEALQRTREEFEPDLVHVCGGFGWLQRNARAIRRVFGGTPVLDEHSLGDLAAWRIYYRSKPIHSFDRFIVESDAAARLMASQCGIPRNRIDIVYPVATIRSAEAPPATLTYLCPLIADHYSLALLDLARRCRDQGWPDIFLLHATDEIPDDCVRYASAARLNNVELTTSGAVSAANAAIVLSPAVSFPTSLCALSIGRPVLSVATDEVKQLLGEFGSGVTIPEGADREKTWQRFVGFRKTLESLGKRAVDSRDRLGARYSKSSRSKAFGEAAARAIRQTNGIRQSTDKLKV
jgi:glycosyltransferase involved in cell wall biosynthesis